MPNGNSTPLLVNVKPYVPPSEKTHSSGRSCVVIQSSFVALISSVVALISSVGLATIFGLVMFLVPGAHKGIPLPETRRCSL